MPIEECYLDVGGRVRVARDPYAGDMAGSRLNRVGVVEELRLIRDMPWAQVRLSASRNGYESGPLLWFKIYDLEAIHA